jgi:hypothetical protein
MTDQDRGPKPADRAALLMRCIGDEDVKTLIAWGREDLTPDFRRRRRAIYYQMLRSLRCEWSTRLCAKVDREEIGYQDALRMQAAFHWHMGALYAAGWLHWAHYPAVSFVRKHVNGARSVFTAQSFA